MAEGVEEGLGVTLEEELGVTLKLVPKVELAVMEGVTEGVGLSLPVGSGLHAPGGSAQVQKALVGLVTTEAAAEKAPLHAVTPVSVFSCSVQAAIEAMSLPRSGAKGAPPCPLRERFRPSTVTAAPGKLTVSQGLLEQVQLTQP